MADVIFTLLTIAFFAVAVLYLRGFLGELRVRVLELNLDLDAQTAAK